MTKLKQLERRNIVLGALAGILVVILLVRPSDTSVQTTTSYAKLFPDFDPALARRIEILKPGQEGKEASQLILESQGAEGWVLSDRDGYPLPPNREQRLLDAVRDMRTKGLVTTRPETFAKYGTNGNFTEVTVKGENDKVLATFGVGKITDSYPDIFVRAGDQPGKERILRVVGITDDAVDPEISNWIEPRLFPEIATEQVVRVDLEQHEYERKIVLGKRGSDPLNVEMDIPEASEDGKQAGWWMQSPEPGECVTTAVEDVIRSITGLRANDIAARNIDASNEATFGFDTPSITARISWVAGGELQKVQIQVGKAVGAGDDSVYLRRMGSTWVYTVRSYTLAGLRKTPADLKPAPAKKEDEAGDTGEGEAGGTPPGEAAPAAPAPGEPAGAEAPGAPDAPGGQADPDLPDAPSKKDDPDLPGEPVKKADPDLPEDPARQDEPKKADEPKKPDEPKQGDEPQQPEEPKQPEQPRKSDEPQQPDEPKQGDEPQQPEEPKKSDEPKQPEEPKKADEPKQPDEPK